MRMRNTDAFIQGSEKYPLDYSISPLFISVILTLFNKLGYLQGSKCCLFDLLLVRQYCRVLKQTNECLHTKNDKAVVWKSQSLAACP